MVNHQLTLLEEMATRSAAAADRIGAVMQAKGTGAATLTDIAAIIDAAVTFAGCAAAARDNHIHRHGTLAAARMDTPGGGARRSWYA